MATKSKTAVPVGFNDTDAMAIKALAAGNANEGQQKRALDWILQSACGLKVWAYRDTDRETYVALGRHFVAQQIVELLNHVPRRHKDAVV